MMQAIQFANSSPSRFHVAPRLPEKQSRCACCGLRELCVPTGLADSDMQRLDRIMTRRRVARGDVLYRMGDPFTNLYAIHLGHFKTHQVSADGAEQITGFQMAGELLGMDAISTDRHNCYAVALEDSEVCEIPFSRLEELFAEIPALLRHFHRTMSQEITRDQNAMLLLGNMQAEQRFAAFLVNLSTRYKARGYSSTSFQFRMSREDIGNYLGLTIESISRLLTKFKKMEWITVDKREICISDLTKLKLLAMHSAGNC
ncbi:MAG TPA: fumarate/nitrate reduction transcriptional regulator Fnr [Burkholderiaceae bacterium]|jgi:CRP/FNR family transcriptional regulator|nr:fumarate/nitrate reduction transcriptional regulator Fnr [Burkholderiaceae bacterium]